MKRLIYAFSIVFFALFYSLNAQLLPLDYEKFDSTYVFRGCPGLSSEYRQNSKGEWREYQYNHDRILISEYEIDDTIKKNHIGEFTNYYVNGKVKYIGHNNKKGEYDGEWKFYRENGSIKRISIIQNGKSTEKCYAEDGSEVKYYDYYIDADLDMALFSKYIIYPENLKREQIEENILAKVLVNEDGLPCKMEYSSNHRKEFVQSIINAIAKIKFTPGLEDGIPTAMWITIPVNFKLR